MGITTVILPGNHDQMDGTSPLEAAAFKDMGSTIHLVTEVEGELGRLADLGVTIWGRATEEHSPTFQPLRGIPSLDDRDWRIAMAHGFHVSRGEMIDRSSPILAEEIAALNVDYLALGHVHVFRDVSEGNVKAYYSGAPDEGDLVDKLGVSVGHVAVLTFDPDFGPEIFHTKLNAPYVRLQANGSICAQQNRIWQGALAAKPRTAKIKEDVDYGIGSIKIWQEGFARGNSDALPKIITDGFCVC